MPQPVRRMLLIATATLLTLPAVACGNGAGGTSSSGTGGTGGCPGSAPAAAPQATPLPGDAARSAFSQDRACYQQARTAFQQALSSKCATQTADLAGCKAALTAWTGQVTVFINQLTATPWPINARGPAQGTANELQQYVSGLNSMTKADRVEAIASAAAGMETLLKVCDSSLDQMKTQLDTPSSLGGTPVSPVPATGGPPVSP